MTKGTDAFGIVSGLISLTAFLCFFFSGDIGFDHIGKIITAFIMFSFGFMSAFWECAETRNRTGRIKKMKFAFLIFFLLYFVILIDFTLIDDTFGRSISNIFSLNPSQVKEYIKSNTNFVPLKTVKLFISAYRSETLNVSSVAENILGNFFVMMPFALFVPCAFKGMNSALKFFLFCSVTVIIVEILQFIFLTGSTDIDDFILNVSGGMTGYFILNLPSPKRIVSKFTFGLYGMGKMKIKANAKTNLTLDICSKREDGYHIIDSVMQSVSIWDNVVIKKSNRIRVWYSDMETCGEDDICFKAAKSFFEYGKLMGGVDIRITKRIPCVAGMGGSSSDAAAVIVGLNKMYKTAYSLDTLCKIGLKVGADVPFCIVGGTARVGGIGEKVTSIKSIPDCAFLIVVLGKKKSTKQMYDAIDSKPFQPFKTENMINAINGGDLKGVCNNISNAFKGVHSIEYEESLLSRFNPLGIGLSGSGPAVFAVFEREEDAVNAQNVLKEQNIVSYVALPKKQGIEIE